MPRIWNYKQKYTQATQKGEIALSMKEKKVKKNIGM